MPGLLDLGTQPLSDGFVDAAADAAATPRFPLVLGMCGQCALVQLLYPLDRGLLFGEQYRYRSACSDSWLAHVRGQVLRQVRECALDSQSKVVEIASNDGYLLQYFAERGIACLGVEPAPLPAAAARARGIQTREAFFDQALAERLVDEGWQADLVLANNVLAHVFDLNGMVAGMAHLLRPGGLAVLEFAWLGDTLAHDAFDTLYHEHLCVFSLIAARRLFRAHGLVVTRVERIPTQGGSLRTFVRHAPADVEPCVEALVRVERQAGLDQPATLAAFGERIRGHCDALRNLLQARVAAGRRIVGYGAAAKGTMLLNLAGIGRELVGRVVDRNPDKQGRCVPGVHIPIDDPEILREDPPDDLLVLPWNLRGEILAQQAWFAGRGGRFILPLPRLEVLP